MSAIRGIIGAMTDVLIVDATIISLLAANRAIPARAAVVNDVPDGQAYPYILVTHGDEHQWHTFGGATSGLGWRVTIRVHIYSRTQSDLEALRILERCDELLNFQPLTVAGWGTVICERERARVLVEPVDKIETRHIPAEYVVRVHQ